MLCHECSAKGRAHSSQIGGPLGIYGIFTAIKGKMVYNNIVWKSGWGLYTYVMENGKAL